MSQILVHSTVIPGASSSCKALSTHTIPVKRDKLPSTVELLVLTITSVEFNAVLQHLEPPADHEKIPYAFIDNNYYYVGRCGYYTIVLLVTYTAGAASTLNYVNEALRLFQCQRIVNLGIAWGANPQQHRMGDILVANKVVNLDDVKKTQGRVIQRGAHPRIDSQTNVIVNRTKQLWEEQKEKATVHIGLYLGSNTLLNDLELKIQILQRHEEAIGGEMESFAIYEAANFAQIPWIIVKGVSDWADGSKHDEFHDLATSNAARFLKLMCQSSPHLIRAVEHDSSEKKF